MDLRILTSDAKIVCPDFILVPFLYHYMRNNGLSTPFHRNFERLAEIFETSVVFWDSLIWGPKTMDFLDVIQAKINELRHAEKCHCDISPKTRQ